MKVLKFGAEWCGPCKVLDAALDKFTGCEVVKYDVGEDENEELVSKYNIRNIPVTILLDAEENIVKKWVGVFDVNEINQYL